MKFQIAFFLIFALLLVGCRKYYNLYFFKDDILSDSCIIDKPKYKIEITGGYSFMRIPPNLPLEQCDKEFYFVLMLNIRNKTNSELILKVPNLKLEKKSIPIPIRVIYFSKDSTKKTLKIKAKANDWDENSHYIEGFLPDTAKKNGEFILYFDDLNEEIRIKLNK